MSLARQGQQIPLAAEFLTQQGVLAVALANVAVLRVGNLEYALFDLWDTECKT